jgi:hypothetical protein
MNTGEGLHHGVDAAAAAPAGRDERKRASQIEDFERRGSPPIDSDVIADDLMAKLLEHLEEEDILEESITPLSLR